jgi:Guanylate-binding protein, N-terminal domain.
MGGLEKDSNYDSRIFSIAALISSCFIYNSTGSIDENAIENLGLIVNLTKMIQNSPTSFFPKFL